MSTQRFPFHGFIEIWQEDDRVSVGLAGSTLPRQMRVSTRADGEVGRALIQEMTYQRVCAINDDPDNGLTVIPQNDDADVVTVHTGERTFTLLANQPLITVATEDEAIAEDLIDDVDRILALVPAMGWGERGFISPSKSIALVLRLLRFPGLTHHGKGRFSLDSISGDLRLITVAGTASLVVAPVTKKALKHLQSPLGRIVPLLIDATLNEWAHEDVDLQKDTTLLLEDSNGIRLLAADASLQAHIAPVEEQDGLYEIFDISGWPLESGGQRLLESFNAAALVAGEGTSYRLREHDDFDLDAWLAELQALIEQPMLSGVARERVQDLIRSRARRA